MHIVQMLNLVEPYPLAEWGHNSARTVHVLTEAMRLAYADRSKHLGDPDAVGVPVTELVSKRYASHLRQGIDLQRARSSQDVRPGNPRGTYEHTETTHFSIVDRNGNAVSNTYTLNLSYGSGHMVPGTGMLLNNQMDDFSAKPGVPNAYGLIGGEHNAIAPGKRMLSSMSPTIVLKDGKVYLVTGSPGGSRIITTTLQVLLNVIEFGMNPAEADHAVRFHHQWLPDILYIERGFPADTRRILQSMGHHIEDSPTMGATQTILRTPNGTLYGSTDPRRSSGRAAGY